MDTAPTDALEPSNRANLETVIADQLALEQGRATARTLDVEDILELIDRAAVDGWAVERDDAVAGAYSRKGAAVYTVADALRVGDEVYVAIRRSRSRSTPLGLSEIQEGWRPAAQAKYLTRAKGRTDRASVLVRLPVAWLAAEAEAALTSAATDAERDAAVARHAQLTGAA